MTVKTHLTHLESSGLIRLAQTQPELEYLFRHALVQDAAYESLLLADRKHLHKEVAQTLERLYADRLEELAPLLGHHFAQAGDDVRALKYFTLAGDVAFGINANAETIAHYSRAIEIAIHQATFPTEPLIHLFTRRGRALELSSRFDEAEANYQTLENLGIQRGSQALQLAGLMARATIYAIPGPTFNPDRGETLCQQTLILAQQLADRPAEAKVQWNLMLIHFFTGRMETGLEYGEQSLQLARAFNLKEQLAYTLNDLAGYFYLPAGKHEQGQTAMTEARLIWQELGNRSMLTDNLATSAFNYYLNGEFEQSHALSTAAYQMNQTIANLWGQAYSHALTGMVEMEWGQAQQAVKTFEEAIALAEQAGFLAGRIIAGSILAIYYALLGDFKRGLALAQQATTMAKTQIGFWKPLAMGCLALIYLHQGNVAGAAQILQEIQAENGNLKGHMLAYIMPLLADCELGLAQKEYDRVITLLEPHLTDLYQRRVYAYLPYLLYYHGQALLGQNQAEQALEPLTEARTLAEKLGSKHILWPILVSLSQLETDPAIAHNLRQQAREIVETIANNSPPDLRASFLNLPEVQAVIENTQENHHL